MAQCLWDSSILLCIVADHSLLIVVEYSIVWICAFIDPFIDLSIHSPTDGQLDDFQFPTVRTSASGNTSVFLLVNIGPHYGWGYTEWWSFWVTGQGHVQLYEMLPVALKGCTNWNFCQQCLSTSLLYIFQTRGICCPFHLSHAGEFAPFWCWDFKLTLYFWIWRTGLWAFVLFLSRPM